MREIVGDGMKAFGRDTGRNTEGRRNQIDFYKYTAADGSDRVRVRFNIKGNKGQVLVWTEVSLVVDACFCIHCSRSCRVR